MVTKSLLCLLVVLLLITFSMADHSDSDSDDQHGKDEHSGDGANVVDGKNKGKKDGKKNKKDEQVDEEYDETGEAQLSDGDIDDMFLGPRSSTKAPVEGEHTTQVHTTVQPPLGSFGGGGLLDALLNGESKSASTAAPTTSAPAAEGDSQPASANHGSPFYPIPRPIDIWDRLFVLAAFPICFFAVMLKAEMFR